MNLKEINETVQNLHQLKDIIIEKCLAEIYGKNYKDIVRGRNGAVLFSDNNTDTYIMDGIPIFEIIRDNAKNKIGYKYKILTNNCPLCQSDNIETSNPVITTEQIGCYLTIKCNNCGYVRSTPDFFDKDDFLQDNINSLNKYWGIGPDESLCFIDGIPYKNHDGELQKLTGESNERT